MGPTWSGNRPGTPIRPGATGVGRAFGTFGELMQGALPEPDSDFLVTLPIARWSTATFRADPGAREVTVRPAGKAKALRLARMIVDGLPEPVGGTLTLDGTLPEGKGLASSSADLVAAARAIADALGLDLPPAVVESYLRRIEPTDGVLHPGVVAYHHRAVRLRAVLGSLPPLAVVGVDEGGVVDTIAFNRLPKPFSPADRREYAVLLDRLAAAVRAGDLAQVGAVATRSAEKNQALRPKRNLDAVRRICADAGGLGVVCAHSGTLLGVLLDESDPAHPDRLAAVVAAALALPGEVAVYRTLTFARPVPGRAATITRSGSADRPDPVRGSTTRDRKRGAGDARLV